MELAQLKPGPDFALTQSLLYYAQRVVTAPPLRRLVIAGLRRRIGMGQKGLQTSQEMSTNSEVNALASLHQSGYTPLQNVLNHTQIANIHAFLEDKYLTSHHDRSKKFIISNVPGGVRMADYSLRDIIDCPHLLELANSPFFLRLATKYIGCKPTISAMGLRWSFPSSVTGSGLQAFHRDSDDWRFVKIFVYLTDVDHTSGPHVYVRGSHLTKATMRLYPYSDDTINENYGSERLITVTGPKGFGFAADTYGIHKGTVPTSSPRLMLQIQYSLLPVYAYRYRSESYDGPLNLDPYINRLIVHPSTSKLPLIKG